MKWYSVYIWNCETSKSWIQNFDFMLFFEHTVKNEARPCDAAQNILICLYTKVEHPVSLVGSFYYMQTGKDRKVVHICTWLAEKSSEKYILLSVVVVCWYCLYYFGYFRLVDILCSVVVSFLVFLWFCFVSFLSIFSMLVLHCKLEHCVLFLSNLTLF